jgi:hypothetical protein
MPICAYYPILKDTTTPATLDTPVGTSGNTIFDPLYGEAVDQNMLGAGVISQPQLSGIYNSANPEIFDNPVEMNIQIQMSELDNVLKRYGFDKTRTLVCRIPTSILDKNGVTVVEGDYLVWDGREYSITEVQQDSFWHNTNVPLFLVFGCNARRIGS